MAEGVETEEQVVILRELGCDSIQGFLVSRPAGAKEFGDWLASRTPVA
ncbi:MAG: EAL domain-containing protein [Steroidobacteraceae bacterium]